MAKEKLCVTGAGGFLASWVVKLLLTRDYAVHGTVRDPKDEKIAHLTQFEKAIESLKLFKADLLDYDSLYSAIEGCSGVFHVASPVPFTTGSNPEVEVIEPAVKGTLNVLKACVEAKVKRVIVVSSGVAVTFNPKWPKGQIKDETCWSDKEYCKTKKELVQPFKNRSRERGFGVCRKKWTLSYNRLSYRFRPILQPYINLSSKILIKLLKDVRDVAEALILAYEKFEVQGRCICTGHQIKARDVVEKLRSLYPNYNYPKSFTEVDFDMLSSEKLQNFGWQYRPLEETLVDSVESFKKAGFLK